ncbi:acyl-CoA dehydrogenase family protein [Amycolatopsis nigrescens]|uniref:acyl-CoA dehydrogenase family protein n=1 Tax=Amycolatopsis nigrescens TaxID=381445 RepID=UPI0003685EC4|nr:acyl-CoA dehydrogenase family protein [Amycolatopsis nigrescens]
MFTEEQQALRETVRAVAERHDDPWPALRDQVGVPALAVPERHGGLGAGLRELQVVAEELGRTLAPGPFLGSAVLATLALLEAGDEAANARLLPRLAGGEVASLAWAGANGRWAIDTSGTACTATDENVLNGTAHYVLDGDQADILLVVAGPALFEVDPAEARRTHTPAMDQTRRLATIELDGVPGRRVGDLRAGLAGVRDGVCAVLAAEQAGAAARALELTVEYTGQRRQFGRPIGGFQALKHRMADLHVLVETARSAAYAATESSRLAAVAKAYCSEAFSAVAAEMIQLHGGIAITWEHDAHRYFKRAHGSAQLFGQPHEHLARVGPDRAER